MKLYPPSFIDRFMRFIRRLPLPYWLTYLLLILLEGLLNHLIAWQDGWLLFPRSLGLLFLFPIWQWGTLGVITYLNDRSLLALSRFKPLLDITDEDYHNLEMRFTSMPTSGVLWSGLLWTVSYLAITVLAYQTFYVGYGLGTFQRVFTFIEGLICYATGSVIYFHSIRQLWLVNQTVRMVKRFNLFQLNPVHAFSSLTSQTGIAWIFLLAVTLLTFPLELAGWMTLGVMAFQVILALAAFILPLRFVNQHLVAEKRLLLGGNQQRMENVLARLHSQVDQGELGEVDLLNNTITVLNSEKDILDKISTWPWRSGTLAGFLSAIGLPVILLLVQIAIQKWLGG